MAATMDVTRVFVARRRWMVVVAAAVALLIGAVVVGGCWPPGPEPNHECDSDEDCEPDEVCEGWRSHRPHHTSVDFNERRCFFDPCASVDCAEGEDCHGGLCLEECDGESDCDDYHRCHEGRCHPLDCSDVECFAEESCWLGACYEECSWGEECRTPGSSDVPYECIEDACMPLPCLGTEELPDGRPCPDEEFVVLDVEDRGDDEVKFTAALFRPVDEPIEDHGFCWSHESDEPGLDDETSDCVSLGELDGPGFFNHGQQLPPGQDYRVRAFLEHEDHTEYSAGEEAHDFATEPNPIDEIDVEVWEEPDTVRISWDRDDGAEGYEVVRNGELIAELDGDKSRYDDEHPTAESNLDPPENVEATQGVYPDRVEVTWDSQVSGDQRYLEYEVIAFYPGLEPVELGPESIVASAQEVKAYRVNTDSGESAGELNGSFSHDSAPGATLEIEEVVASQGDYEDRVHLKLAGVQLEDGEPVEYTVEALGADDEWSEPSEPAVGWRRSGNLQVQWQRYEEETSGAFEDLPGADDIEYDDYDAPEDGSPRFYRALVDAVGISAKVTESAEGHRAVPE